MRTAVATLLCLAATYSIAPAAEPVAADVSEQWAKPLDLAGVGNGYKVSEKLYRSAQPRAAGMQNLKQQGIKTVLSLRAFHTDREEIGGSGLESEQIPMYAWQPTEADVVRFLKLVSDTEKTPVLVHCQHGADRTGLMCAIYRVAVDGWSKQAAIEEMKHERYGFHKLWVNIPPWIEKLDIDKLRMQAGLPEPAATP